LTQPERSSMSGLNFVEVSEWETKGRRPETR